MARGRTCYDHLAGRLGVALTDAMTDRGLLRQDTGFALTEEGVAWLTGLGLAAELVKPVPTSADVADQADGPARGRQRRADGVPGGLLAA